MNELPFGVGAGVERTRQHALLAAGDVVVVSAVLVAGLLRHNQNPVSYPGYAAVVLAPFLLGWAVAAVLLGTYTVDARGSPLEAVVSGVGTWLLAALLGAALRATPYLPGNAPPTFVAVVAGTGAVGFVLWRGVAAAVLRPE